ncbi:terpene synthase family protein [Streptomyces mobaraensis]|uniref:terpene synthase family protein n=1 Tax=Streptomyces mobaraensis TaxID=35621 RepID=UPI0033BFB852
MLDDETSARLRHPFPTLVNPHAADMQEHTDRVWIDGECAGLVPPDIAERSKKTRAAYVASYFYPVATWERLEPLARMMLFSLHQDDIHERVTPRVVRAVRVRTVAVARGKAAAHQAEEIHGRPTVRRLKSLAVRLPGWFNKFQSYDKDQRTGMGNLSLINVVRRERSCSLADAREWVFRLHENDLDEFARLQRNLPDFREGHDAVENHIRHFEFVVSGRRGVDAKISRYDLGTYTDHHRLALAARVSGPGTKG